jgi:mRNA interferase MazF
MSYRGDIVVVRFPYSNGGSKMRPALVVQSDRYNSLLSKTVIAMITSNLRRTGEAAHLLIDPSHPDGASSRLQSKSLVSCNNLHTIEQTSINRRLGNLSDALMQQLDGCLKAALDLS